MAKESTIKFKYIFNDDYNPVYINGAHGGISPQGEIIANFYLERLGLPNSLINSVTQDGKLGDVIESDPKDLNQSHVRFIRNGIIMNLQTAKTIHRWLGQHIETLEKIQGIKPEKTQG